MIRLDIVSMCSHRIWLVYFTKSKQLYSIIVFFLDSYEDSRRHLSEATSKSVIDSNDLEQQPMGRGYQKKSANASYSPYKEVRAAVAVSAAVVVCAAPSEEDSDDSSVRCYGPTQSTLPNIPVSSQLLDTLVHSNTNEISEFLSGYKESPEVVETSSILTTVHHEGECILLL